MEILYILIPIALVFVAAAVRLFVWAVKSGQYDDLNTEGKKILFDEPETERHKHTDAEHNKRQH